MEIATDRIGFALTHQEEDAIGDLTPEDVVPINPGNDIECELNYKQYLFASSLAKYPAMLGAKGASKTWGLIFRCLYLMVDTPIFGDLSGNRGFIARKEWQSFKNTVMREIFRIVPRKWIKKYVKSDRVLVLENGSELVLGHFDDLSPIVGINLGFAAFSQVEQMDLETWIEFQTNRVRMVQTLNGTPLLHNSCFCEGNPPGPAHWTYLWFANEDARVTGDVGYDERYQLIHSKTIDNKKFLPADHFDNARKNLSDRRYRIDIEGSPEGMEGQCFEELDQQRHFPRPDIIPKPHWKKGIAIDYGRSKGNACAFLAIDCDSWPWKVVQFDEAYTDGGLVEDHVALIVQKLEQHRVERVKAGFPDVDLWQYCHEFMHMVHDPAMVRLADGPSTRTGAKNVTIVGLYQEAFRALGVPFGLRPADNDVDAGLDRCNFLFRHDQLAVNWRCVNTRHQAVSYIIDPRTGKPKDGQKDHQCDALRYGVAAFYIQLVQTKEPKKETVVDRVMRMAREEDRQGEYDPHLGRLSWTRSQRSRALQG